MTPSLTELKVAVLAGGVSSEREVSLRSGAAVHAALLSKGLDAVLLDVDERAVEAVRKAQADIAFIALHGAFGEDGRIQQALAGLQRRFRAGSAARGDGLAGLREALPGRVLHRRVPGPYSRGMGRRRSGRLC